ncbi:NADP-dependent oxidoreductase [Polycyclovorans algicola]|uniref:NADP-dependent oxidoreductase n=1 Tax=Polycyclovorans algicola TaxID=616992 RepID=UPI0004A6DD13|nr:NADP-dependent oxidoreductase [Polycyclovorans algicola]
MNNRQIILASRPVGIPQPEHFELVEADAPGLKDGEFLVENHYLSVDPAQRGYVNDENNYAPPVPIGAVMRAMTVGKVIASKAAAVKTGEYYYGWFGWQDYCAATPATILRKVDPDQAPLSTGAGLLGINGLTAYLALHDIGQPKPGETVLVTAAAGAVGSIVGQLAKQAGARPVAVVGSDEKGEQCVADYGYAAYVNYKQPLEAELREACPKGVDVFFDNTSGEIADTVYGQVAMFGRVIQCGTMSIASWVPTPMGPRKDREILTRRLRVQGFVIFDHAARYDATAAELAAMLADGRLRYAEDIGDNIADAPQALVDVYAGRNRGKKLIRLR